VGIEIWEAKGFIFFRPGQSSTDFCCEVEG
jgi:hypothetical protein